MKELRFFTLNNKCPMAKWLQGLSITTRNIVDRALDRLALGNLGKVKNLKGGLFELKIQIHSGIRIYFTYSGDEIIILLRGGNKSTQKKDIEKAREYLVIWRDNYEQEK